MEEEILIGLVMVAQEVMAETLRGPQEEALEDPILKKKCIVQSATNAAKGVKFLSGQQERSQCIAAIVSEKVTGLNQKAPAQLKMILMLSMKSSIEFWMH